MSSEKVVQEVSHVCFLGWSLFIYARGKQSQAHCVITIAAGLQAPVLIQIPGMWAGKDNWSKCEVRL